MGGQEDDGMIDEEVRRHIDEAWRKELGVRKAKRTRPRKKGGAKRVREPRYAIKTRTDVDIMDDGFKWRKYGQKAVKNSPHPRNYYRCTTPNCPVRKRVERSCEDSGLVITTYEGTHTHQTPGFHRSSPSHGFFGERPVLGLGGGLFAPPHKADRQQQQQQAAARLNILRSSSSGGAGGQQISEESLQKSSQEISRGATDQGLLEDIVRPGSGQGPPP
ncbi:unnamed protein product, partial [Sphagnum tenellum]